MNSSTNAQADALIRDAREEPNVNRRAAAFMKAITLYQQTDRDSDCQRTAALFAVYCATVGYARETLRLHLEPRLESHRRRKSRALFEDDVMPWADQRTLIIMAEFPQISTTAIHEALGLCQADWQHYGSALLTTAHIPLVHAIRCRDAEGVRQQMASHRPAPKETGGKTLLCDTYRKQCQAEAQLMLGRTEEALATVGPMLEGREGCSADVCALAPAGALSLALLPLLHRGQRDLAESSLRLALKQGAGNGGLLRLIGCEIAYLTLTERPLRAIELLCQHYPLTIERATPWQTMHFLLGAEVLAHRYPQQLAKSSPCTSMRGHADNWLHSRTERLVQQFDQRNGNPHYAQLLASCRSGRAIEATLGV